jgi:flagellar export protein FliJ
MEPIKRLIQLRRQKLEAQQHFLSTLRERLQQLEHEIAMLHHHLKSEQKAALESAEGSLAYVRYAANLQIRLDQLKRLYQEVTIKYETERQKLQDLFGELKSIEIYDSNKQQHLQKDRNRKEQSALDDLYTIRTTSEQGFLQN